MECIVIYCKLKQWFPTILAKSYMTRSSSTIYQQKYKYKIFDKLFYTFSYTLYILLVPSSYVIRSPFSLHYQQEIKLSAVVTLWVKPQLCTEVNFARAYVHFSGIQIWKYLRLWFVLRLFLVPKQTRSWLVFVCASSFWSQRRTPQSVCLLSLALLIRCLPGNHHCTFLYSCQIKPVFFPLASVCVFVIGSTILRALHRVDKIV